MSKVTRTIIGTKTARERKKRRDALNLFRVDI